MLDFLLHLRTKFIFGKGVESACGREATLLGKKALLHYGGGSIKATGLYDRVVASLNEAGVEIVELPGVQPNPRLSLVRQGIEICREKGIDLILAVGGGSVIDSAKCIAAGARYQGDVWDLFTGAGVVTAAIPIGVVLTLPAAGSEASANSVITNEDGWFKRGMKSDLCRPAFALLNPELTYTLPPFQTACGAVDIIGHVIERYFSPAPGGDMTDRLCEGIMRTVLDNAPVCLEKPEDYEARANVMWAGTLAHCDIAGVGRVTDWATHQMEHELSGIYDVAHGAGLAVLYPAWMRYVWKADPSRFLQFAQRVMGVEVDWRNPERTVLRAIDRLEGFYKQIGMPTRLKELGIGEDRLEEMAEKCKKTNGDGTLGTFMRLTSQDVLNIYRMAL